MLETLDLNSNGFSEMTETELYDTNGGIAWIPIIIIVVGICFVAGVIVGYNEAAKK
jgi:lactobin A/cerein 7B family class IIb bacteriocin